MRKIYLTVMLAALASYIYFIVQLGKVIIHSCITEIISAQQGARAINTLITSPKFYLYIVAITLLLFLAIKIFGALTKATFTLIKTNIFIKGLEIKKNEGNLVIIRSKKKLAFTAGFLNPKIYVSDTLIKNLSESQYEEVIRHELTHVRNRDPLMKLIVGTINSGIPTLFLRNILSNAFLNIIESFNQNTINFAVNTDSVKNENFAISWYTNVNESKTRKLFIISVFSLLLLSGIFLTFGSKVYAHKNLASICSDKTTCELLQSNSNISGIPTRCVEILYSPVTRTIDPNTSVVNLTSAM